MDKIRVKLHKSVMSFHDIAQDVSISHDEVAEVHLTDKVQKALRSGRLLVVENTEPAKAEAVETPKKKGSTDKEA